MKPIFLYKAAKIAEKHTYKRYPMAAIARRADGAIVSAINHNTVGKNPAQHAEARVLRKCDIGAVLYVARISKQTKKWLMAKPCPDCQRLIKRYKVKEVYYTISENEYGRYIP